MFLNKYGLLLVILNVSAIILGIIFDVVGVAMTSVDIAPFHAMNSKKKKGAKVKVEAPMGEIEYKILEISK